MSSERVNSMNEVRTRTRRYDVFLSFLGEDTCSTFTGNLYNALRQKRIKTFFLPENDGEPILSSVLKAIQESRISIVVISKNYASSMWHLDELVNIMDCMRVNNQLVWPVFYDVNALHVWFQRDSVKRYPESERVRRWREALLEIINLTGWSYRRTDEYEYIFIQKIVKLAVQSLPRFDVFLSFSGEDARYSFTGFLYQALCREGFKTFMDDEGLKGGNQISKTLLEAIEKSRLSIVVFSENYGYSPWCLDELVKIVECMKTNNQLVWPIFYKISQSDVSNQTKSYGHAMLAHENSFGKDSEKVQKWKSALSEMAFLQGEHITENEYEYKLIKKIVEKAIAVQNHM
ncbi:disease resistance protein RPV1-like isoform X1 [Lotus japonicus]|uniref:disease resistance protein RPV1-like isoform X1 n=1 Tax=Lotus japonicus TaxID=34305 RepID=UPI00258F4AE5|nr:disease resistance protein RPV1-like isoform X1 [Lotus japonicus]